MTSLRFVGDLPLWGGLLIGFAICGGAVLYYRREMVQLSPWLKLTLPTLRALAFMMAILMLTGPVLHHRKIEGELGQVKIYVCLLYTSPSPRDVRSSRMPSSA